MQSIPLRLSSVLLAVSFTAIDGHAESLRCNGKLVQIGDSKATVLAKCGEPLLQDTLCLPIEPYRSIQSGRRGGTTVQITDCETVDEWTYNPGYGRFLTTLRFVRGELRTMKYGDRVR